MKKLIHKGDESRRRWNIIDASRSKDVAYVPQLLALLEQNETHENKRHIIRALGNIGGPQVEERLLQLLDSATGLMLGDVVRALGEAKSVKAKGRIKLLVDHEVEWVRQNAKWGLSQLSDA